jgi:hypothetical protein
MKRKGTIGTTRDRTIGKTTGMIIAVGHLIGIDLSSAITDASSARETTSHVSAPIIPIMRIGPSTPLAWRRRKRKKSPKWGPCRCSTP